MKLTRSRALLLSAVAIAAGVGLAACRTAESPEVEVEIRSIGLDQASRSPVVVLQDKEKRVGLPIWIGPAEAQSIAMQMEGIDPPRPLTHDLMKLALEQAGVEFERVVIQDLKDSTYYARIYLHSGRKAMELDSRPSDAIALALRFHKPIFVTRTLLQRDLAIDLRQAGLSAGAWTRAGITMQDLTAELAEYFGLPAGRGVLVSDVNEAARTELKRGDIILEIDGVDVDGVAGLQAKVEALADGARADLAIRRGTEQIHVDWGAE
ncbi:MAG: bifunctional nuclease family protein [Deltaproteobacteria bacterium]|nr:bifunctional nuclease family protein [Deltaproteobacteria bacterium]